MITQKRKRWCVCVFSFCHWKSDIFGCTISKHRCERSKITEGSNDGKLKVKRPGSRFHKWFEHQRSEHRNPMVRLPHKYHITENIFWRRIRKVHRRVTKMKNSWYGNGLVIKLSGKTNVRHKAVFPILSPRRAAVTWLEKKYRCKTKNWTNYIDIRTNLVTCEVIWEVITKVGGRCYTCRNTN